jgi:3-oxoacyl-[acyl-carrier protein] reductase
VGGDRSAPLRGRVAIVTGAAQGIGEGIAGALLADGARVALLDVNADAAAEAAQALGGETCAITADVSDRAAFVAAVESVERRWGDLDILVNNAAVNIGRPFDAVDPAEWDTVLAINLRGVHFGCQIAGERMRRRGFGRIVNLASDAGQQPNEFVGAHYAASKGGVIALTKVVARALAPHGVTVNAVAPAAIEGPVMATLPAAQVQELRAGIPVGRFGRPDEVGALVAFLAGDRAGYITGATLDINGGQLMR